MAKKSGFFSWFNKDKKASDANDTTVAETSETLSPEIQEIESQEVEAPKSETQKVDVPETETTEQAVDEDVAGELAENELEILEKVEEAESTIASELNNTTEIEVAVQAAEESAEESAEQTQKADKEKSLGFFERLKLGLSKTRQQIGGGFKALFTGKQIDDELYEELETQLLIADVGMDTTVKLIDSLTEHADRKQLKDADSLYTLMKEEMSAILEKADKPLVIKSENGPFVILMVGVNGVGKTTTIGKMAKQFQQQGKSVMLAAGDTFRAAAVEQLQVWGERNSVPVIAQHTGADSASVIFDAYQAAKARNADVLIADTAGRLQNKENLMQELEKIVRVLKKLDENIPHEVMLTIDATTGQNAMSQTKLFNQAVGLTGISLTKLDGSAKGGVIFSVASQFDIPIRYIGVGEGVDDLRTFEHKSFIDALFD